MSSDDGILSRISSFVSESPVVYRGKEVASDTFFVAKKLFKATGKAAWIFTSSFLVLALPFMVERGRTAEQRAEVAAG